MKRFSLTMLFIAGLVIAQMALAKGPPQKVTVSGGDLTETIEITGDETTLTALGTMYLEDFETRSNDAPEAISGDGYLITRFFYDAGRDGGVFVPFDQVRFYPHTDGFSSGYIQYIGITNGSSEYDGQWFRASREGQAVLENAIAAAAVDASAVTAEANNIFEAFFRGIAQFIASY